MLTAQEQMFLDRLASYLPKDAPIDTGALRAAGERVLVDDRRLASKVFRDDAFQAQAAAHLAGVTFDRITK